MSLSLKIVELVGEKAVQPPRRVEGDEIAPHDLTHAAQPAMAEEDFQPPGGPEGGADQARVIPQAAEGQKRHYGIPSNCTC